MREKTKKTESKNELPNKDSDLKTQNELLKKQLAELSAKFDDYTNHLKRLQAEFENYQKRIDKERVQFQNYASERVIVKLLNIIDDFDRAVSQLEKTEQKELFDGVKMIAKQLHKVLDEEGVKPILSVGEKLDANKHEVMLAVDDDSQDENIILEELQKGYTLHNKVIRYAKVKICKKTNGGNIKCQK